MVAKQDEPAQQQTAHLQHLPLPSGQFYRPELDVLRFLAAFLVFWHHALGTRIPLLRIITETAGFGMCLFFFLSSFLINELLQREKARTTTIRIRAFYYRRILRIWPLYFGFLGFGILLGFWYPTLKVDPILVLCFVFLAGNWYISEFRLPRSPVGVLWSISLEEQFYVLWPLLSRLLSRRALAITSVLLLPLGSLAIYIMARSGANPTVQIWVNSFVQFQFFGLGALLALVLKSRLPKLHIRVRIAMVCFAFVLWLIADIRFGVQHSTENPSAIPLMIGYYLIGIGCISLIVGALGIPTKWLPRPLIYLGKISYGFYVFHVLCLELAQRWFDKSALLSTAFRENSLALRTFRDLFAFGLTILLAALSYRFYESPFLRLKERFTVIRSRAV